METELRIILTALGIVASILTIIKTWLDIQGIRSKKKAQNRRFKRIQPRKRKKRNKR